MWYVISYALIDNTHYVKSYSVCVSGQFKALLSLSRDAKTNRFKLY